MEENCSGYECGMHDDPGCFPDAEPPASAHAEPIQEVKPVRRIGTVRIFGGEAAAKLEQLVTRFPEILNLKKYLPEERYVLLSHFGIAPEQQLDFENLTPTVGFAAITKAMTGNIATTSEILVNIHALGSGSTAPVAGNTQLQTEVARVLLSSLSYSGASAYYTAFYGLAAAVGTHHEMGLFINGSAGTPNSGVLWDRTLLDIVKTNTQSLTLDYLDTLTNA